MPRPLIVLFALLVGAAPLQAQHLPAIDRLLQREVDAENVAGAVVQVVQGGEVLHRRAYGFAQRYDYGMRPLAPPDTMTTGHLFDLASLTKVLGTTFAVMLLVDRGTVDLDAPLTTYLPEFTAGDEVTVRHLLTHTAGLSPWKPIYYHASTPAETYDYLIRLPLEYEVGGGRHYSDLGFMLLGFLVERVTGERVDAFLRRHLYQPLGLERTTFTPLDHGFDPKTIAATSHGNPFERRMVYDDDFGYECDEDPTSWDGWRRYTLRGEVNDGNAFYANGGVAGHAGLFSTVDDVQTLIDVLRRGGRHGDAQIVRASTVRRFLTPDETGNGLGWMMNAEIIPTVGAPEGSFGHTGFTGTYLAAMPEHDLSIILLTNRQNVGTNPTGSYYDLNPTRQRVVDVVLEHLTR